MVIMGVAGSGKTSVGEALAARLGIIYRDGDTLHPPANVAKMRAGIPLTDDDRWPWLERVAHELRAADEPVAIGCSALKRRYRDFILHETGAPVLFVYLSGPRELIESRMHARTGHFMPTSLLDSQFATLEEPQSDENAVVIDIEGPMDDVVNRIVAAIHGPQELPAR